MMAKAIHDGRAFPIRISYALARCICGDDLRFDDLGGIFSPHMFELLKLLRSSATSGTPICEEVWCRNGYDCLDFTLPTNIAAAGCKGIVSDISRQLHLVHDGDKRELTPADAAEYVRAIERMYLGDGVAMQIRALRSGFYSVIEQSHIAALGPCGLLNQLGCLGVAEFDLQDLRLGITPFHPFTPTSPQYLWLIDLLSRFDQRDRLAFLRHVTGAPVLPNGFQGLKMPLQLQLRRRNPRDGRPDQPCGDESAPFVHTCAGLIQLPL